MAAQTPSCFTSAIVVSSAGGTVASSRTTRVGSFCGGLGASLIVPDNVEERPGDAKSDYEQEQEQEQGEENEHEEDLRSIIEHWDVIRLDTGLPFPYMI